MFLILALILCVISFAVLYIMKAIVKVSKDEIANKKGSMVPLVLILWGFNVGALLAALGIMDIVSFSIPFFEPIHSEWGIATTGGYFQGAVYCACLALLHGGLLSFSYFFFKRKILNRSKRIKILVAFVISSAFIWALLTYKIL